MAGRFLEALVDRSIANHFGWPDLEFAWKQDRDIDPLTQAQINQIYLAAGVLIPGEVRAEIGKGDAAAKRQAGGVALGKDWQTQGRQGEGAKNPAWFGNGTGGGSASVVPVSHAATYGAAGAVIGGAAAAVGSVVLDGLSGGVNAPLTPAEVAAGAAVGGVIGHEVGRLMDQWSEPPSGDGAVLETKNHDASNPPVPGAVPGEKTNGSSEQWDQKGDFETAKEDMRKLGARNIKRNPDGSESGVLPDGRTISVRPRSSGDPKTNVDDGPPTLQIDNKKVAAKGDQKKVKVRYIGHGGI